jgi:hypothetical protein
MYQKHPRQFTHIYIIPFYFNKDATLRTQIKPTQQQMINISNTLNMDTIHEKKRGKAGASRRQPAPSMQRIRVTNRTALCLLNAKLAHSAPELQWRLPNSATAAHACSCRVSICFLFCFSTPRSTTAAAPHPANISAISAP